MSLQPKILVVDDNEIIRSLLHELLTRYGYYTTVSSDGLSSLELIKKIKPHIVVVDLMLPDISGIEVIKRMRKLSPSTEAIIITGYSSYESALNVLDSQTSCGFLEKPVDINKLVETIEEILQHKENQFKILEELEEAEKANYQLEFFNTVLLRDFMLLTSALDQAIKLLSEDELTTEQKRSLSIFESIYTNNVQLIKSYNKLKRINELDESEFQKIDIVGIILKVIEQICDKKLKCNISFKQANTKNQFLVKGTKEDLIDLFYETIYSMIMPSIIEDIEIDIEIKKTAQYLTDEKRPTPTIGIELTTITNQNIIENNDEITSKFDSQKYGLGFYLAKNLVDFFKGKIFLEDDKEDGNLKTTLFIFLPAA